jgi:mRNA-degrading endonuclease toxin of MazEF toxin-antitoxin module
MNLTRGDATLACFLHAAGGRGKKRPVVVVQNDVYNPKLRHVIVAEVTTNRTLASDPAMGERPASAGW